LLPPEKVKKCLSRMSWKLSRTVLRRGKGSNPFFLVDFTGGRFSVLLSKYISVHSNSRKGNPYDNAVMESFYIIIKRELIKDVKYETHEQAQKEIFKYIEGWYNRKRLHSSINYMIPYQCKLIEECSIKKFDFSCLRY
ncbi:integrase core domain-containing protein, partial [Clostridium sporogenes]|uniref:integrase core domain-containing protein n=1 Tax=Clostridium sporogenes TaxID=1509 RepID=UPI003F9009F3